MKERLTATISGRVQMVMYRDFATRMARRRGIVGRVWNNQDGTVGIIAEGESPVLDQYLELLKRGSILSLVEKVTASRGSATGEFDDFLIQYSPEHA